MIVECLPHKVDDFVFYTNTADGTIIPCVVKECNIDSYKLRVKRIKENEHFFIGTNTFSNNAVITAGLNQVRKTNSNYNERQHFKHPIRIL